MRLNSGVLALALQEFPCGNFRGNLHPDSHVRIENRNPFRQLAFEKGEQLRASRSTRAEQLESAARLGKRNGNEPLPGFLQFPQRAVNALGNPGVALAPEMFLGNADA